LAQGLLISLKECEWEKAPLGTPISLINAPVYKVRVRNTDIPKGKRSGYRLIYKFDKENKDYLKGLESLKKIW